MDDIPYNRVAAAMRCAGSMLGMLVVMLESIVEALVAQRGAYQCRQGRQTDNNPAVRKHTNGLIHKYELHYRYRSGA